MAYIKERKLTADVKRKHMSQLAEYRRKLYQRPELRSLFIEMTGYCNEHCRHCGSNCGDFQVEDMLTREEICGFLSKVRTQFDIGRLRLCVTGGEPLLREDFFEIMEYANSLGYSWGMTSNGTLIDIDVAKKLLAAGMKTVSVSVDGLEKTHDWFRQKKGSYKKTIAGIENLILVGGFSHVQITTVVHKKNINELEKMYKLFSKLKVRSWRVINIEPIGRAATQPELLLEKEDYKALFDFIKKKRFAGPMEVTYGCSHYVGVDLEREVRTWYFLCNAGVYVASIMCNGDIGACLDIERRPELFFGNIRKDDFKEVWEREFKPFRIDRTGCESCKNCSEKEFCAGDSFHTWNFDENRPNLCMKEILF